MNEFGYIKINHYSIGRKGIGRNWYIIQWRRKSVK